MSAANFNRLLWMLTGAALWAGGCADNGPPEPEPKSEPASRREIVVLTPADSGAGAAPAEAAPSAPSAPNPVSFDPDGQFTVQVGVYRDAKRADQKVRQLKDEGYPAYSVHSDAGARVRIGYFATHTDADRFGRIFAKDHSVEYWIDRRTDE